MMDWTMIPAVTVIFGGPLLGLVILISLLVTSREAARIKAQEEQQEDVEDPDPDNCERWARWNPEGFHDRMMR